MVTAKINSTQIYSTVKMIYKHHLYKLSKIVLVLICLKGIFVQKQNEVRNQTFRNKTMKLQSVQYKYLPVAAGDCFKALFKKKRIDVLYICMCFECKLYSNKKTKML